MRYMASTVLCCLAIGRCAEAMDKPPDVKEQRVSLRDVLVKDMTEANNWAPGTFGNQAFPRRGRR